MATQYVPPPDAEVKALGQRLSNWGRWGPEDEIGTLNFLTDSVRVEAMSEVKTGEVVGLTLPIPAAAGTVFGGRGGTRFDPIHRMIEMPTDVPRAGGQQVSDDMLIFPLQSGTQWDALSHIGYDGFLYNGVPISAIRGDLGAQRNAITAVFNRLLGRGVLLDVASATKQDRLAPGQPVLLDDLLAAVDRQAVTIRSGDIVLIRTGWIQLLHEGETTRFLTPPAPGLGVDVCEWFHDMEVAAVGVDNFTFDVRLPDTVGITHPVHLILIRDMGMTIGEMYDLESLSAACQRHNRWSFMITAHALPVTGAVGSPAAAAAIF